MESTFYISSPGVSGRRCWRRWFLLLTLLLLSLFFFFFMVAVAAAQEQSVEVSRPEPAVEGQEIVIEGSNLNDDLIVMLVSDEQSETDGIVLTVTIDSPTLARAQLPDYIKAGTYQLKIVQGVYHFNFEYEVMVNYTPVVIGLSGLRIYNTRPTPFNVSLVEPVPDGFSLQVFLRKGADEIPLATEKISPNTYVVTATAGILPGEYETIVVVEGTQNLNPPLITVLGAINAEVDNIHPDRLHFYDLGEHDFELTGSNLTHTKVVATFNYDQFRSDECPDSGSNCSLISKDSKHLTIQNLDISRDDLAEIGIVNVILAFPDGDNKTIDLEIIDRTWIWDFSSAAYLISLTVFTGFVLLFLYHRMNAFDEKKLSANRQAPPVSGLIQITLYLFSFVMIISINAWIFSLTNVRWPFLLVAGLMATNTVYPMFIHRLGQRDPQILSRWLSIILLMFVILMAWIVPYIFNSNWLPKQALYFEAFLFITIFVVGVVVVLVAGNRLEELRKRKSDQQISSRVEQVLWQEGAAEWEKSLNDLPADRVDKALTDYYQQYRDIYAIAPYEQGSGRLSFVRANTIAEFNTALEAARNLMEKRIGADNGFGRNVDDTGEIISDTAVDELAQLVGNVLGFSPQTLNNLPEQIDPAFRLFGQRDEELESFLPNPFPLIMFMPDRVLAKADMEYLRNILNTLRIRHRFAILIPLFAVAEIEGAQVLEEMRRQRIVAGENLVVLGEQEIRKIIATRGPSVREELMTQVHKQVNLTIFSPFVDGDPTGRDMFFGRVNELNTIYSAVVDDSRSALILATRKHGKSSILRAAYRQLLEANNVPYYLECDPVTSYEEFFHWAANEWEKSGVDFSDFREPLDFGEMLTALQELTPEQPLVFLLDEIDRLLNYDISHGRHFFRALRALSQSGRCQFVFTGERAVHEATQDSSHRFWNFAAPVQLQLFDLKSTQQLVVHPFTLIGVSLENEEAICNKIFNATDGHPFLIQLLCKQCLLRLGMSQERLLTLEMLEQSASILQDEVNRNTSYVRIFLAQATPIEEAIAVHVAWRKQLGINELEEELTEAGFSMRYEQLEHGMRYLMLGHILQRNIEHTYEVKLPHFCKYLFDYRGYESRMKSLRRMWAAHQEKEIIQ